MFIGNKEYKIMNCEIALNQLKRKIPYRGDLNICRVVNIVTNIAPLFILISILAF